ncbi:uncharacterized protein LOC135482979 [Lineus longissimus]|uniref:uncharacterized protein LOC135482979 n=1 Tax=Lineus longissimus TaxID=88925 RepID=UPI00315D1C01
MSLSRLPPPEPPVFSGDPLLYAGWLAAFKTLIEGKGIPPRERMHYLRRYLAGPAKEAVEGYFLISSDSAFDEAKAVLEQRYGNPFNVAEAFRNKLEGWPKVHPKDSQALRKFSDSLRQCEAAKKSIGSLRVLDDDRENRKLLMKLPDWLVKRWARIVADWRSKHGEYPPFRRFTEFVYQESEIANDPVTGTFSKDQQALGQTQNVNKMISRPKSLVLGVH